MRKIYYLFPVFLLGDIISKYLASVYLESKIHIFWDMLFLEFVKNTGIAFSFPITWVLLKIITVVLIFWIILYYIKEEKPKNNTLVDLSFILILSGAVWNALERIFLWEVIDFIWVKYFAVFNIADSYITIWALIYIYYTFFIAWKK